MTVGATAAEGLLGRVRGAWARVGLPRNSMNHEINRTDLDHNMSASHAEDPPLFLVHWRTKEILILLGLKERVLK